MKRFAASSVSIHLEFDELKKILKIGYTVTRMNFILLRCICKKSKRENIGICTLSQLQFSKK